MWEGRRHKILFILMISVIFMIVIIAIFFKQSFFNNDFEEENKLPKDNINDKTKLNNNLDISSFLRIYVIDDVKKPIQNANVKCWIDNSILTTKQIGPNKFEVDLKDFKDNNKIRIEGQAHGYMSACIEKKIPKKIHMKSEFVTLSLKRLSAVKISVNTNSMELDEMEVIVSKKGEATEQTFVFPEIFLKQSSIIEKIKVKGNTTLIRNLKPNIEYLIMIQTEEYSPFITGIKGLKPGELRLLEVTLNKKSQIKVLVIDKSGNPVDQCKVKLLKCIWFRDNEYFKNILKEKKTDPKGYAFFKDVPSGKIELQAEKKEDNTIVNRLLQLDLEPASLEKVTLILNDSPVFILHIIDEEGLPLQGTKVNIWEDRVSGLDAETITNDRGTVKFVGFKPGPIQLVAAIYDRNGTQRGTPSFNIPEGENIVEKTYQLEPPKYPKRGKLLVTGTANIPMNTEVKFALFDLKNANRLKGGSRGGTQVEWPYEVDTIPYGKYMIELGVGEFCGYLPYIEIDSPLNEVVVDKWAPFIEIEGTVIDENGEPIKSVELEILMKPSSKIGLGFSKVNTDESGTFHISIPDLPDESFIRATTKNGSITKVVSKSDLLKSSIIQLRSNP